MPTPKNLSGYAATLRALKFPSGAEIYDAIMGRIEPELLRANLKKLDAPYKDETPAQKKKRYARYSKAFALYRTAFKAWSERLKRAIRKYQKTFTKVIESANRTKEDKALSDLEQQILST